MAFARMACSFGNGASRVVGGLGLGALALLSGCDTLDKPVAEDEDGSHLVIPTDIRPAFHASRMPPPISGGTLLVTRSGALAVASDPERDAIVVADLAAGSVLGKLALTPGDEPGRLVEDAAGRVHVALRRGGAVVTIDPTALTVLARRSVCGAPRGLALAGSDSLAVACADGALVTLPLAGDDVSRRVELGPDLRDVIANSSGGFTVSRLKSAELLRVDASGALTRRDVPPSVFGEHSVPDHSLPADPDFGVALTTVLDPFRPHIAWRTLAGPAGSTIVVHQRALDAEIELVPPSTNGSSYGGGSFQSCNGIVQNAISIVSAEGAVKNLTFAGPPLPVDAMLLPDQHTLLVVHAGTRDLNTPRPFVRFEGGSGETLASGGGSTAGVTTLTQIVLPDPPSGPPEAPGSVAEDPGCTFPNQASLSLGDQGVAVAFNPARPREVVVQMVQPSKLVVLDLDGGGMREIGFDDGATLDTGFQLFHRDSGAGLACATCHAEGAEDGNVWHFSTVGPRRTQALHAALADTAPFHWDGLLVNVRALMSEVFVGRMAGVDESTERLKSLERWLFALKAPVPLHAAGDPAVERGKALFRSSGCGTCHSGPAFTNNQSFSVGTDSSVALQVPSLIGVGYRAPFIHDGCANTLAQRFDPACGGGDLHGSTSTLGAAEIGDLVQYLESL